ncbi:MAG: hypothetical protein ACTHN5_06605 [Phycisphaerae bacterium]
MTTSSPSHPSTTPTGPAPAPKPPRPPEWPSERFVKTLGKLPAIAGRFLDRLARRPLIGPPVRFFSSVWIGIGWLLLLGLYIGIGSGLPSMRAKLEMTDLQFFDAWPMRIILAGLALSLIVVTLRRIPLTLFKLGVWTVHIGILTLIGGAVWYFSHKVEGSVRIYLNHKVSWYYDATERSLYAWKIRPDGSVDPASRSMIPLPTLPIFYEHIAEKNNPLNLTLPAQDLATTSPALAHASLQITGYYPAADLAPINFRPAQPGEKGSLGHALAVQLSDARQVFNEGWLVASSPANRLWEFQQFAIEYLHNPAPERLRDLAASFDGPVGITVRIPKLHIEHTYAITSPDPIHIEGSPYTLTPQGISQMPMLSKGYENTQSTVLTVHVVRQDPSPAKPFEYNRMCVFRYPERSPDFMNVDGKPKRFQDGVDPDIQIVFHDASKPQFWITEDNAGKFTLYARNTDGKSTATPFANNTVSTPAGLPQLQLKITQEADNVVETFGPRIIPPEQRQRGTTAMDAMLDSMIELHLQTPDGWKSEPVYVPFVQFAQVGHTPANPNQSLKLDEGREPTVVNIPGIGPVGFILSTTCRALPSTLQLADFKAIKYPGASRTYLNYISTLKVSPSDGPEKTLQPELNDPAEDQGLYYFQAAWDGDQNASPDARFSVIGVGNRPGVWTMAVGALLMILGIGYAFYVKPILLNKKKHQLAAWAASNK